MKRPINNNRQIAEQLVVSKNTIRTHVSHILRKLNVTSRTQAVAKARALATAWVGIGGLVCWWVGW